jgi:hypothetical protein
VRWPGAHLQIHLPSGGKEHKVKHPTKSLSLLSEHRLHAYTVAATAAGVGVLCLTQAAEAKVVYTPANVKIVQNAGLFRVDLNHDGIADFALRNTWKTLSSRTHATLTVERLRPANEIWGNTGGTCTYTGSPYQCAAALPKGTKVGPKGNFKADPLPLAMAVSNLRGQFGPWLHVKQAYLGLKFVIKGKTHFGWARVKVSSGSHSVQATLTGYAYETTPGKPIIAGATKGPDEQAGSLGALAAGAVGR